MNNFSVHQADQKLNHVLLLAVHLQTQPEVTAHYARYLCVLCSGFVETSVRAIFSDYARARANPTADFVVSRLQRVRNPKMEAIHQLVRLFDESWSDSFKNSVAGAPSEAVDSIVNLRNKIAHGGDTGISLLNVQHYHRDLRQVIIELDGHFPS